MTDITLYAFPTGPGFFNFSPYCGKVDIMLKMAGLIFTTEMPEDYKVFSKGKLPVLKDGDDIIQDSEFIRYHLAEKYSQTFDDGLTSEAKAIGHAVCRMLDDRTILAMVWTRWIEDAGWAQTRAMFFEDQSDEIAEGQRALVKEGIEGAGFGKHSQEEMKTLIHEDLRAISDLLGEQEFFLSNKASYLDATVFSFIANLYGAPIQTWIQGEVAAFPNLVAYFNRGMALWYPEAAAMQAAE
jgi:glutathione S-transferase